jgi:hypothetical protein
MKYLVTTNSSKIPLNSQIFMVDGTVPGWIKKNSDFHWDHHRPQGSPIQLEDLPKPKQKSIVEESFFKRNQVIVTTQIDADACVAAAFIQLSGDVAGDKKKYQKLEAIAWDCDHLTVPKRLSHLSDFAAQAGASMKVVTEKILIPKLALPEDRNQWTVEQIEKYSTQAFEINTEWLIKACNGQESWPGEKGEASEFWEEIEKDTQALLDNNKINIIKDIPVFDITSFDHLVDPHACLKALRKTGKNYLPMTLTIKNHPLGGIKYTLGCDPLHSEVSDLNYVRLTFSELSREENIKEHAPLDRQVWGGRKTVGGSGWNHPSVLSPKEVVDIVLRTAYL